MGVDKPLGLSSHAVVDKIRNLLGEKRVGHGGTLDPLASGVLLIGVGPATRLLNYLTLDTKAYRAQIEFGSQTSTDDIEGEVIASSEVPQELFEPQGAEALLSSFLGKQSQVPPNFSAVHVDGKRAYDLARKGSELNLQARAIEVYRTELLEITRRPQLVWDVYFSVSKGSYIRSLARDIGLKAHTHAHLKSLRRLKSGLLDIAECNSLDELSDLTESSARRALDPVTLLNSEIYLLEDEELSKVQNGLLPSVSKSLKRSCSFVYASKLYAYLHIDKQTNNRETVFFPEGIEGVQECTIKKIS